MFDGVFRLSVQLHTAAHKYVYKHDFRKGFLYIYSYRIIYILLFRIYFAMILILFFIFSLSLSVCL